MAPILLFISLAAFSETNCTLFQGRACIYIPEEKTEKLHIYIRGHHNGRSDFSPAERTKVAAETLANLDYGLTNSKITTIASGSSAVSFSPEDIERLEKEYQQKFTDITVTAHSGGYLGLNQTLRSMKPQSIRQILMLDNFYSTIDNGLIQILKDYTDAGIPCHGFMTEHNVQRVKKHYHFCEVEGPQGMNHNRSVGPFLETKL